MTTQKIVRTPGSIKKYGFTEKKKSELDALTLEVLDAQHDVAQFQAMVTSLTEKSNNFQGFLALADANRTKALNNRNLLDQLEQNALDLATNSGIAYDEMVVADQNTEKLAKHIKVVMDKLIYSAEVINKLSNLVIRKKALNPLISDELVSIVGTAGSDANNAVALTLVALQSTFASQSSNLESSQATALEYTQSRKLYMLMTGNDPLVVSDSLSGKKSPKNKQTPAAKEEVRTGQTKTLHDLLYKAYQKAKDNYHTAHEASIITTNQLNSAQASLNKAQVKLRSLQLGLAAGNAAALAS